MQREPLLWVRASSLSTRDYAMLRPYVSVTPAFAPVSPEGSSLVTPLWIQWRWRSGCRAVL